MDQRAYPFEHMDTFLGFKPWSPDDAEVEAAISKAETEMVKALDERLFYGELDKRILGAVPTAPDGSPLFATTQGGNASRFWVNGGNLIAGDGSVEQVTRDFKACLDALKKYGIGG